MISNIICPPYRKHYKINPYLKYVSTYNNNPSYGSKADPSKRRDVVSSRIPALKLMHKYGRPIPAYSPTVPIFLVQPTLDYKNTAAQKVSPNQPHTETVLLQKKWWFLMALHFTLFANTPHPSLSLTHARTYKGRFFLRVCVVQSHTLMLSADNTRISTCTKHATWNVI